MQNLSLFIIQHFFHFVLIWVSQHWLHLNSWSWNLLLTSKTLGYFLDFNRLSKIIEPGTGKSITFQLKFTWQVHREEKSDSFLFTFSET